MNRVMMLSMVALSCGMLAGLALAAPAGFFDEGFAAYSSWRVYVGDVPGRDLWLLYAPGTFYLQAGAFSLAGVSLETFRAADLVVKVLLLATLATAARRAGAGPWFPWCFGVSTFVLAGMKIFSYSMLPALLFALLAVLAWAKAGSERSMPWAVLAGALAAWTAFFRQDIGIYVSATLVAAALAQVWASREKAPLKLLAGSLAGVVFIGGLAFGWPLYQAGAGVLWEQLIGFPVWGAHGDYAVNPPGFLRPFRAIKWWIQTRERHNLGPLQIWTAYYPALFVYAAGLYLALRRLRQDKAQQRSALVLLMLCVLGLALLVNVGRRPDMFHVFPTAFCVSVVLTVLIGQGFSRKLMLGYLLFFTVVQAGLGLHDWIQVIQDPAENYAGDLPVAGRIRVASDLGRIVDRVRTQVEPAETLLVVNANHKKPLVNHILLLFLAQRRSALHLFHLHPGLWPRQEPQIMAMLSEHRTPLVVWSGWAREPGDSDLDRAIRDYGSRIETIGDFTLRLP